MYEAGPLLLVVLALHYAVVLGLFALGFARVRRRKRPVVGALPRVSVVIAARDEGATIGRCVEAVLASDYPRDRFEVVVVDDGSTDGTAAVVRRLQQRMARRSARVPAGDVPPEPAADTTDAAAGDVVDRRLRLLAAPTHDATGKRHALALGIEASHGDVVLTTDADCEVGPGWIRAMAEAFTPDTAFVSGPVCYRPGPTRFGRMQALEFFGLVAVGAGAIGLGRPNLCNGANVAYRRDVYERLGRLDPSRPVGPGDDEVLIQRIAAETDWAVRFCARRAAVVWTQPVPTVRAFLDQRRRWARMTLHYPSGLLVAQLVALYAFFVLLLAAVPAALFAPAWRPALGVALGLKMAAEAAVLVPACRHFGQVSLLRVFGLAQPLHALYLVYAVAAGVFRETRWKGRRIP